MRSPLSPEMKRALVATFIARTAANAALRVVYPFLPAIARGLDVTPATLSALIAVRNLGGTGTPVVARLAEKHGRRSIMVASMLVVTLGCGFTVATGSFFFAAVGIIAVGFAKPAFDIAMQAWMGDRVDYADRGRIFGITELTWSVALVVVPISAVLIEATDWRAPFVIGGLLSVLGVGVILRGLQPDRPQEHVKRKLRLDAASVRALSAIFLAMAASEVPFIVYGQWLENDFGLTIAGIGAFTIAIAIAELAGEGLVVAIADRLGLKRMWMGGLIVSGFAYLAFALVGSSLAAALTVVVVWIVSFEITIVAAIPFASELSRDARDRLLSLFAVMVSVGRASGALIAQPIFASGGIRSAGFAAAGLVAVSVVLLWGVPEHPGAHPS